MRVLTLPSVYCLATIAVASMMPLATNAGQHGGGHGFRGGPAGLLKPDDRSVVTRGAAVYAEQCASCHGKKLEGQPNWRTRKPDGRLPAPPHDETGHTWHHPDRMLFRLTKEGPAAMIGNGYKSDMPGFAGTLSDDDIVAVLSYIKSTWPDNVRFRHDRMNRHRSR